jgi:hypothetical protein
MKKSLLETKKESYFYSPIACHESWLAIDPIIGCRLNCEYCYMRMTQWTAVRPERLYTVNDIVDLLLSHPYFLPHETVLSFGNQTDAFLPDNADFTIAFFEALEQRKLNNPLVVSTKKLITPEFLERANSFKHVKPVFCLSYSGLPEKIQKGVNPRDNEKNFEAISQMRLPLIHFWRPLIAENGSFKVLKMVLNIVGKYAMASAYLGLRNSPDLHTMYASNEYLRLPDQLYGQYGDSIPTGIEERLKTLVKAKFPDYPVYKHTSCAISYVLSIPEYNATNYNDLICKSSNCPSWKRRACEMARTAPSKDRIRFLLERIGLENAFTLHEQEVEIVGEINQEEYAFLLHHLRYPLRAHVRHSCNLWGSIYSSSEEIVNKESKSHA